ncbi:MAG: PLP-dependent transferase, partial [Actinobacteria bacterium]|nr:PLP-dependent transferase [Actinomycetota bacterium]
MDPSTLAVTLGRGAENPGDPVNAPVTFTSTYRAGGDVTYARDDNPSWHPFEEILGGLEGGTAVAFASGLAAASAVIETLPAGAVVVAPADAYNGTRRLLADLESRKRLRVNLIDMRGWEETEEACEDADLLWVESPSNPLLSIFDVDGLVQLGHQCGALVAVDNTFATPLRQRPLDFGADVVVHSATKLLAGHSDVVMGAAVAVQDDMIDALRTRRSLHGGVPGPMEAFLAARGLRTLAVRLERAETTAVELEVRLADHSAVEVVRYPGFGSMVSFDVEGGAKAADRVCEQVQVIVPATSLGGVETTIERRSKWALETHLPPGLLRLSVGLEHVEDLWDDLARALG